MDRATALRCPQINPSVEPSRIQTLGSCFRRVAGTYEPLCAALRENPKPTITYRWNRRRRLFQDAFGWTPAEVFDAEDVAREYGFPATLDMVTREVVGSDFCRRGANFGDSAVPSAVALEHRATRVTVVYEFVVRKKEMRSSEDDDAQPHRGLHRGAGPHSGGKRACVSVEREGSKVARR